MTSAELLNEDDSLELIITTPTRNWELKVSTEEEKQSWVNAFNVVISRRTTWGDGIII